MLHPIDDKKTTPTPNTKTLQIAIVLVIGILLLTQSLLIYVILSRPPDTPVLARPKTCDNFEMKSPEERALCRPVNYAPKNSLEA